MNNNINAESFVTEFLETDNIGKWLYDVFSKSAQLTLFGQYLQKEKDIFEAIEESIKDYNYYIDENNKKKEEIENYTDIEKANFAKKLNEESSNNLQEYFDDKTKYVNNFKERLAILDKLQESKNEYFKSAVKDLYTDLQNILSNYDDIEVIEERLKSLTKSSIDNTITDYLKVLDLNNSIFEQRIKNAEHVRDNLKEIKKDLDSLPNIESKI